MAEFPGTAIIISHDRYFLQKIPDRILELTPDGMVEYLGKYDYYMEKREEIQSGKKYLDQLAGDTKVQEKKQNLSAEEQRRLNKQIEAEERRMRRRKEALEQRMEELETEIASLEEDMTNPENSCDYELLASLGTKIEELRGQHDEAMLEWMELEEKL